MVQRSDKPILEHPSIRAISFTGGTATGRHVAATAAPMFKKLSLELGGKNATIVLDDADLDAAVDGAVRAGFTNGGQVCLCGSRILVHRSIAEQFTNRLVESVDAMICGSPENKATQIGALISMDHLQKVESYIQLGVEEGGTILTGGTREMTGMVGATEHGAFLRPTIIDGLDPMSRTSTEEIFGRLSQSTDSILMKKPLRLQIRRNMDLLDRCGQETRNEHMHLLKTSRLESSG